MSMVGVNRSIAYRDYTVDALIQFGDNYLICATLLPPRSKHHQKGLQRERE